jgi:hypothetical protein
MIEFIFTTILMLCLGTVLYLTARALPRIAEEPAAERGILERWARSEMPEKIDAAFNNFLLKFLRKFKIAVLRLDNTLSKHLRAITPQENRANTNIDFKEIAGQNREGNEDAVKTEEK